MSNIHHCQQSFHQLQKLIFYYKRNAVVLFPSKVQDDRFMAFKKRCHPETCRSAGEGPSIKPHSARVPTDRFFHLFQKLIFYYNRKAVVQFKRIIYGYVNVRSLLTPLNTKNFTPKCKKPINMMLKGFIADRTEFTTLILFNTKPLRT